MRINPVKIYQQTIITRYGRRISGGSRGYEYDVFIKEDNGQIEHKLYYVRKAGEWIKSRLLYFSNNKQYKEIKSENIRMVRDTSDKLDCE